MFKKENMSFQTTNVELINSANGLQRLARDMPMLDIFDPILNVPNRVKGNVETPTCVKVSVEGSQSQKIRNDFQEKFKVIKFAQNENKATALSKLVSRNIKYPKFVSKKNLSMSGAKGLQVDRSTLKSLTVNKNVQKCRSMSIPQQVKIVSELNCRPVQKTPSKIKKNRVLNKRELQKLSSNPGNVPNTNTYPLEEGLLEKIPPENVPKYVVTYKYPKQLGSLSNQKNFVDNDILNTYISDDITCPQIEITVAKVNKLYIF